MAERERLPDNRAGHTHKFNISGHEGYVNVGYFPDGRAGEVFITMSKEGSTMGGLMDTIGILASLALQYGVPAQAIADKLTGTKFEPLEEGKATSIPDYVFRWVAQMSKEREEWMADVLAEEPFKFPEEAETEDEPTHNVMSEEPVPAGFVEGSTAETTARIDPFEEVA